MNIDNLITRFGKFIITARGILAIILGLILVIVGVNSSSRQDEDGKYELEAGIGPIVVGLAMIAVGYFYIYLSKHSQYAGRYQGFNTIL